MLKRWYDLDKGMEFRCFIKDKKLIAISQRDITQVFDYLKTGKSELQNHIKAFINEKIITQMNSYQSGLQNYIVDIYLETKKD